MSDHQEPVKSDDDLVSNGIAKAAALQHVTTEHRLAEAAANNRIAMIATAISSFGATWPEIAEAMGLTKAVAYKRYGPAVNKIIKGKP